MQRDVVEEDVNGGAIPIEPGLSVALNLGDIVSVTITPAGRQASVGPALAESTKMFTSRSRVPRGSSTQ